MIGTFADGDRERAELLVRVEDDGSLTTIDDDLTLSNGLAWSPDGRLLYSVDTFAGVVWVREYDATSGEVGARRAHLEISGGYPDGMCVDARGYLWVAIWDGGEVRSYTPSGQPAEVVRVPAPHVSSVAFVGRPARPAPRDDGVPRPRRGRPRAISRRRPAVLGRRRRGRDADVPVLVGVDDHRRPLTSPPSTGEHVHLMRIGALGAEKPVARLDDESYVDLSDVVDDFDERFFGSGRLGGLARSSPSGSRAGEVERVRAANGSAPRSRGRTRSCASA